MFHSGNSTELYTTTIRIDGRNKTMFRDVPIHMATKKTLAPAAHLSLSLVSSSAVMSTETKTFFRLPPCLLNHVAALQPLLTTSRTYCEMYAYCGPVVLAPPPPKHA